jgi:hypothetical protein
MSEHVLHVLDRLLEPIREGAVIVHADLEEDAGVARQKRLAGRARKTRHRSGTA